MTGETAAAVERRPSTVDSSAETRIQQGTPAFRRTALALFLAGFSTFGLLYTVQPLLPEFSRHFGVSAAGSAMSLSLTTGTLAVAMLLAGLLSDAVGRRPLMIAALLASGMLSLSTALVDDWTTLLVLRTLLGLALSGVPAVAMTYLVEEMDSRALGLAMGLYIGGNAIGGMSGRLLAGIIADHWGGAGASAWSRSSPWPAPCCCGCSCRRRVISIPAAMACASCRRAGACCSPTRACRGCSPPRSC